VRGADSRARKHAPLRIEPEVGQSPEKIGGSESNKPADVLHEDEARSHLVNDSDKLLSEVPLVVEALAFSGGTPRLARDSRSDAIHDSTPRSTVEGAEIRPDRRLIQVAVAHPRCQDFNARGFPLHITDASSVWNCKSESQLESSIPGT